MGVEKNRNMNKNDDGETPILISTPSTSIITDNKIEGGNASKKMKGGESLNSSAEEVEVGAGQSQCQESSVKETSIDNLPPEMVMQILKSVDNRSLFKCRLVSRQWNTMSSRVLFNRPNAQIKFTLSCSQFVCGKYPEEERMTTFLECLKTSKNSPYSHFTFTVYQYFSMSDGFDQADFKEFLSDFYSSPHRRIKYLKLNFLRVEDADDTKMFITNLGDLLLNKIPRLENLVLNFQGSAEAPQVKLFPASQEKNPEINANQRSSVPILIPVPAQLELPHLKVLHLESPMISLQTQVVRDLLTSTVNLNSLRVCATKLEDFDFIHSLGKSHLLKGVSMEIDQGFFSSLRNHQTFPPVSFPWPKLEFLRLIIIKNETGTERDQLFLTRVENFLGALFESSKDTLAEFKTRPLGFLPRLQLPIFHKLRKLGVTQYYRFPEPIFLPGIRSREIFPNVSELKFYASDAHLAFPQPDSIPLLPRVKSLTLNDRKIRTRDISILASMCPNLKNFYIQKAPHDYLDNVEEMVLGDFGPRELDLVKVGRAIWTHMPRLESLEIDVDVSVQICWNSNDFDSSFTGISDENLERLRDLKRAEEKQAETGGFQHQPKTEEYDRVAVREFPSILNMTSLKKLTINPYFRGEFVKEVEYPQSNWLTWISQEYAFKLMPHLQLRVNCD